MKKGWYSNREVKYGQTSERKRSSQSLRFTRSLFKPIAKTFEEDLKSNSEVIEMYYKNRQMRVDQIWLQMWYTTVRIAFKGVYIYSKKKELRY